MNTLGISRTDLGFIGYQTTLTDDEKISRCPGVYRVMAYAVNRNSYDALGEL